MLKFKTCLKHLDSKMQEKKFPCWNFCCFEYITSNSFLAGKTLDRMCLGGLSYGSVLQFKNAKLNILNNYR